MPLSDLELPELFEFIDTHFHLDVLIRRLKSMCKELNYDEVEGTYFLELSTMYIHLRGSVAENRLMEILELG